MPAGENVDLGEYRKIEGLAAGALNAYLVPPMDVSGWKWISLYIGTASYVGQLSPQYSYNLVDWQSQPMYNMSSLDGGDTTTSTSAQNVELGAPLSAPYFCVQMTSYTSGVAGGTLQLHKQGLPGFQLLTTNVRILSARGQIGYTRNDGSQNFAIAAGHAGDTILSGNGGMLGSILVTAAGSHDLVVYDNASAPSGTVIGIVPAAAIVDGKPWVFHAPANLGIVVAGNAGNHGVTIFY